MQISTKLGTKHPLVKGIRICLNEGTRPFPRGDNCEIVRMHCWNLKIFFSRTTQVISTKLGTKHPWVKGIQVCSNEGPRPSPRGDTYEIVKIHGRNLKIISPEPLSQFQPNLVQNILGWRGFKFVQNKGPALFQGDIITKWRKYIKNFLLLLQNLWAKFNQTYLISTYLF